MSKELASSFPVTGGAVLMYVPDWSIKPTQLLLSSTDGHLNNLMSLKWFQLTILSNTLWGLIILSCSKCYDYPSGPWSVHSSNVPFFSTLILLTIFQALFFLCIYLIWIKLKLDRCCYLSYTKFPYPSLFLFWLK